MELQLTDKQFRRLLDMVYIGNWVLNSTRGDDRIQDYDKVEALLFSKCDERGMAGLSELYKGKVQPSRAFAEGGIHEAIMAYEDDMFFEMLAEELARRDLDVDIDPDDMDALNTRCDEYLDEFRLHGTDNVIIELDNG